MKTKSREYEGEGIVVSFDLGRCIHAKECVTGLPNVFDIEAKPWIQPGNADADAVAEVVRRCPTGALGYRRTDGAPQEEPAAENTVRVVADGPLYLAGRVRLHQADDEVLEQTRVALCRCGDSKNKPFCDNTHVDERFSDPGLAIEHRLGEAGDENDGALNIRMAANGPILLEGPVRVLTGDGAETGGGKGALCRCGASEFKPYCDGSHKAAGFTTE